MYARIKTLCEKKGISIAFLERELELPRGSIYKWGKNEPGVIKVQKVANYFKVTMEDLLKKKECE
ncbi:helix-turn-helix transcriptional regulator [Blautia liquoris]|uniref:Helix-turn-helix transcriptional regulator n=1 Tax=Blautia liquoris TaxID=2779518 RepID=A0A7M2RHU3_9FIRM|nr:helix-turn-helix transcriptional regulator [Blautia liquoris]QOV18942.1 helix-turn-helix transcriptional regulator [Blautia liquoris]